MPTNFNYQTHTISWHKNISEGLQIIVTNKYTISTTELN